MLGGKMLPKAGRSLPADAEVFEADYALLIAEVLRAELGDTHQALKLLIRWTGANERTAKNWMAAVNGPSGEHLLRLMRYSDGVFECVLRASGRRLIVSDRKLVHVRDSLRETATLLSDLIEPVDTKY
ncbi:hypothetical protein [Bradyrhizobium viridifuturi]|uniref:hypothetical protein n=1 Tax=Bradyrhizobium viridifuturi TaxID=1654716 RepID=UPI001FCD9A2D|nr:hypothetical protein [Bradyrhizobium viridifuturi]